MPENRYDSPWVGELTNSFSLQVGIVTQKYSQKSSAVHILGLAFLHFVR